MADSETANNRKVAPPLKFTSMTKNNSDMTLSSSSSISKPRLLTAPKALGSSKDPRSLALSRTTGSVPSFSKLREIKSGDPLKRTGVSLTNSSKSGADNSNEFSKHLNNLSHTEGKLIQNGPSAPSEFSRMATSWLKRPRSQPSLQHINSNPQMSAEPKDESSTVNDLRHDLGSEKSKFSIGTEKCDMHEKSFDKETAKNASTTARYEPSVSKLGVTTSNVDQNQNIKELSPLCDVSKSSRNVKSCGSDSVLCDNSSDNRKWKTDLPEGLTNTQTNKDLSETSNTSDKYGKGHNSGLSTSRVDKDGSDCELTKGTAALSKSFGDQDLETITRQDERSAEVSEDDTPVVSERGSVTYTSSANLVLSTSQPDTQTDTQMDTQTDSQAVTVTVKQTDTQTDTQRKQHSLLQGQQKPETPQKQNESNVDQYHSVQLPSNAKPSMFSPEIKVDIKTKDSPRKQCVQSTTHFSSHRENNEISESLFPITAKKHSEEPTCSNQVGTRTSKSNGEAEKSRPFRRTPVEMKAPKSSFQKPVESKILKSSLKKKDVAVSNSQGELEVSYDKAADKSKQNLNKTAGSLTSDLSEVKGKNSDVGDNSKCQVLANQDVTKSITFFASVEPPSTSKGKDVALGVSLLGTSKSLFPESMTISMDLSRSEGDIDEKDDEEDDKDEGLSFSMSSTSSFMKGSNDTMSDVTLSPPISPFNSPLRKETATFVTSTPKPKTPNTNKEVRRHSLPVVESDLSENSSLKYSLVDIDLTNSYREKRPIGVLNSPNVTKSLSFSSGTPLAEALSLPTPSPRRKPRVSRRTSQKLIRTDDEEFIGFATLPDQVHRKAVKRGFEFGLMVVGETGLGKSTLINSLFLTDLYKDRKIPKVEETIKKTVHIEKKQLEIEERGVKLRLTIVDTPGFNDSVNGEENWTPIIDYIDNQFDQYYQAESGLNRKNIQDTRVHCCLYFISPYGHGLKPVDIAVMKRLHTKVNIVPLLAKSDILTPKEVKRLKAKILDEIKENHIQIYQFPECDSDEDEDFKQQDKALKAAIPFAVVGSNTVVEAGGKKIRGRMYPWGIVEVDNPKHCDFGKLRQMLISTHMQDLKDITADLHYENYRAEHLAEEMKSSQRERSKLKRDSIINLDAVSETDKLLQQKEAEIQRMQAMLAKMQAQLQSNQPPANGKVANS